MIVGFLWASVRGAIEADTVDQLHPPSLQAETQSSTSIPMFDTSGNTEAGPDS